MSESFRAGVVAVVGRPNVGKSTLVNALVGEKVAITSPKAQTTRNAIRGIVQRPAAQVVFVDTPGLSKGGSALHRLMRRVAGQVAAGADVGLVVVDAKAKAPVVEREDREAIEEAKRVSGRVVLVLNKADRISPKQLLLPWIEAFAAEGDFAALVPVSALRGDGLEQLMDVLVPLLPEGEPLFPAELHTDAAERFLCEELVREQILRLTEQEVPHRTAVVVELFEDERTEEGGLCRIEGAIVVERESQKGIIVGKGGRMIKAISTAAREEMERLLQSKVFLRLHVKVERDWTESDRMLRELGLAKELK